MDLLVRIKRLVVARRVEFTLKATEERLRDGLTVEDVLESIVNANVIKKIVRSRSSARRRRTERLYVIESRHSPESGCTARGPLRRKDGQEAFYVLISSKLTKIIPWSGCSLFLHQVDSDVLKCRFAAGVASNLEVVQAQEAVALASEQYIGSLYSYNLAKGALVRALGIAEETALGGPR